MNMSSDAKLWGIRVPPNMHFHPLSLPYAFRHAWFTDAEAFMARYTHYIPTEKQTQSQ